MQAPSVNLAAHWLSVVKLAGNNSQVKFTQFNVVLVASHPQETVVAPASNKLLQSEAVINDEHKVGFVKH